MWTGWSFLRHEIKLLLQTVEYMKPITFLVTCNDVVLETLRHSKQFAAECGAENIVVTYDLAIAKNGKKIQCGEQPTFEVIFIQLGRFYTELNGFFLLGKFIEGVRGP